MKKISIIIGTRPNLMKALPVYDALKEHFNVELIHTGQHFDEKMSNIFFNQFKFKKPDIHLILEKQTKSGDYDNKLYVNNEEFLKNRDAVIKELTTYDGDLGQLGEIRDKLIIEFEKNKPDLVVVFGDVTSTLAAGLAANILNIELAHVESGLRSFDLSMPEEVNRILIDHITKYYFVTEQSGIDNLKNEDKIENVYLVGNTMIDTQKKYLQQALDTKYHETLGVKSKEYVLITLHRPSNVDNMDKLQEIFDEFEELSKTETLVYPIHPRTKNNLEKLGYLKKVQENTNIILDEPLGYLEFTCLMANCKYLVTDSGGLQEESTSLDIPCFTLRENTERPCTLIENNGTNQLISKISEIELKKCKGSMELWDGKSSIKIISQIIVLLNKINQNINLITIDTFLLDFDNSKDRIDELFDRFLFSNESVVNQIYKNFIHIIYVDNRNKYLIEKLKNNNITNTVNRLIMYYDSEKVFNMYPNLKNNDRKNKSYEGEHRQFYEIRTYLKGEALKLLNISNKVLVNMALDDDDFIDNTHILDINTYANYFMNYINKSKIVDVYIMNLNIYYLYKIPNEIHDIYSKKYIHGNKFMISNSNTVVSGYNILENIRPNHNNQFIITKPKSTFYYVRYGNNISNGSKQWMTYYTKNIFRKNLNTKNVLFYSTYSYHLECTGVLFDLFHGYNINVYFPNDKFNWIKYYNINKHFSIINSLENLQPNNYSYIVILSSNNTIIKELGEINNKYITILHLNGLNINNIKNHITLSPFVKPEVNNSVYINSIYNGEISINKITKNILYIGYFIEKQYNELKNFINECYPYTFTFLFHDAKACISKDMCETILKEHTNVEIKWNVQTNELIKSIKKCKYILCRKCPWQKKDRYSGTYNLALSYKKPMILQKELNEVYNYPCLEFDKNYCEVSSTINNMTDEKYNYLIESITKYNSNEMLNNKEKFDNFLLNCLAD
jgi:UDP-N-acetylglucosamine 2-epimerase (non-hydrolysing)